MWFWQFSITSCYLILRWQTPLDKLHISPHQDLWAFGCAQCITAILIAEEGEVCTWCTLDWWPVLRSLETDWTSQWETGLLQKVALLFQLPLSWLKFKCWYPTFHMLFITTVYMNLYYCILLLTVMKILLNHFPYAISFIKYWYLLL